MSEQTEYKFTKDWFEWAPAVWEQLVPMLPARKSFLEIGSYEGRSTVWTVENMLEDGGAITCIDTWQGGEEHIATGEDMSLVEANFEHNMNVLYKKHPKRSVYKLKAASAYALAQRIARDGEKHDFIYIDGGHTARDVLTDACMAWNLLKVGGLMVFDDYMWGEPRDILHRPKIAIDAFMNTFAEELEPIYIGYQAVVRRTK